MPAISPTREFEESYPVLVAVMTNRSPRPICISNEVLKNTASIAVGIGLRDRRGRAIPSRRLQGYIPPARTGFVRVDSGATVAARYYLAMFRRVPAHVSARLTFSFDGCDGTPSSQASSGWQSL